VIRQTQQQIAGPNWKGNIFSASVPVNTANVKLTVALYLGTQQLFGLEQSRVLA
jgi:hypothetical protein